MLRVCISGIVILMCSASEESEQKECPGFAWDRSVIRF